MKSVKLVSGYTDKSRNLQLIYTLWEQDVTEYYFTEIF